MTDTLESHPQPVEREVLSELVKDRILTWILEGVLAPGSRIVETRVARELGTSQAPVREALRDLATLGFVEMQPYRGSRVRKPSKDELIDAIEVRAELEALAGKLAATRRTDRCLADLDRLYAEMDEAADRNDPHDHALKNTLFHQRIVEAAHNPTLTRLWSMLEPFARTYVTASASGMDLKWLGHRHDGILEAIRDRDPERAAQTMREHAYEAAKLIDQMDHPELVGD
ncbi:MAG: GntR family transcriptional regulator [Actinobacteria bacterium]|nr:GntR family transcriptional regulator [Actinomycetota bacterium]MBU1492814.1 GntR family transcriptional regulator [Actinomycetota bacterium]